MKVGKHTIEREEDIFNINSVLMFLFSSIKSIADEKNIELIYEMDSTLPRKLRGDSKTLLHMLTEMLTFVFQNSDRKDIILSILSPKDFLYKECISFKIHETNIPKEEVLAFLEINLSKDLEMLGGKIVYDHGNTSDIYLSIPFKNGELGFRRHYRLPDKTMVGKKTLLLFGNEKKAQSVKKMFEYFLYDVHVGFDDFKKYEDDLAAYDILIMSEKITTKEFEDTIARVQEDVPLKYVLFRDSDFFEDNDAGIVSENFIRPATQEKIFDLIVSLFKDETETLDEIKFFGSIH